MIRNEIENGFFLMKFLVKHDDAYIERFTNFNYYLENKYDIDGDKQLYLEYIDSLIEFQDLKTLNMSKTA